MLTQNQKPKPTEIWIESSLKPILRTPSVTPYSGVLQAYFTNCKGKSEVPDHSCTKKRKKIKTKNQNPKRRHAPTHS